MSIVYEVLNSRVVSLILWIYPSLTRICISDKLVLLSAAFLSLIAVLLS